MFQTLIIFALLSIIPAGVVFLVLHTKNQEILRKIDMMIHDADVLDNLEKAQKILYGDQESIKLDIGSVKESFQRLSNKIASRSRTEEKQERRTEEPPIEQQEIPYPFPGPYPQQVQQEQQPARVTMQPKKWRRTA